MQELRGNIRVYVRVKPGEAGVPSVLHCEDGHRITCATAGSTKAASLPTGPRHACMSGRLMHHRPAPVDALAVCQMRKSSLLLAVR